jgi:hypothetical protein
VRAHAVLPIALASLVACAGSHAESSASSSPTASPSPLRSCEIREFSLDGADLVVQANVDGTAASIVIVHASDDDARAKAYADAVKDFGDPAPDTRTQMRQLKDGLMQPADLCGRPIIMPSPSPSANASPG